MFKTFLKGLFFTHAALAITVGAKAPSITAKNQDGKTVTLGDYLGKQPILLYFYPKDDTPGCTKEACQLRGKFADFKKQGALVFGVSTQDEKSHKEFQAKHHLPFDLLVDTDGTIAKAYGIERYPMVGLMKRQSVLIGKDGNVLKFYSNVNPDTHADQALKDLLAK
jgi:peroxiredoxin Q/BCP